MKNRKGFTLVELVIVIIIVGILSVVAVPIYRGYTIRAMASEGKALLGSISAAQQVYYTQWGHFAGCSEETSFIKWLGLDVRANKYFKKFKVNGGSDNWNARSVGAAGTKAEGITAYMNGADYMEGYMWVVDSDHVEIDKQ